MEGIDLTEAVFQGSKPLKDEPNEEVQENVQGIESEATETEEPTNEEVVNEEEVVEAQKEEDSGTAQEEVVSEPEAVTEEPKSVELPQSLRELNDLVEEDEYIKNALEYYKENKTLKPYLEALSVDYNEVSDVDLLRIKYERENPDLDSKVVERLFKREVLDKYSLNEDEFDEDEIEIGRAMLKRDAGKVRQQLISDQKNFIPTNVPQRQSEEEIAAQVAEQKKIISSNLKSYLDSKAIKIESDEPLSYQVKDASKMVDYAMDNQSFFKEFIQEGGDVNWEKWAKTVAFMQDPDQFINSMISHGKSLGKKSFEQELKNPDKLQSSREVAGDNLSDNPFENPEGFLQAALKQKGK